MGEQLDYTTLTWVKDEIQESLNQTHQALEAYIEDTSDTTQIRFCATYLHQIYGTLQMVEIYGAALLAEEMEKVANALLNEQIAQPQDAFEVLIRATLQLPAYLERLENGQPDMPVVLTPLLNDMRAARGEPLLSENAFFTPNLNTPPPEKHLPPGKDYPDSQVYAKKLRPIYQIALLGVLRDKDTAGSLKKMAAVMRELQNACEGAACQRLWWVAGGIIEALIDEGLQNSTAVKMLLGQVDREIRRLIKDGEAAIEAAEPADLIKNCLYYTGTALSSGPRVSALKQAFDLEALLPYGGSSDAAADELKGTTADIMDSVSSVIKDDLLQVKDQLDIFVRNPERAVADLSPLAENLSRTADTLAMLSLGDLRRVIQDQASHIEQLVEAGENPADADLMEVASALLYVESSLDHFKEIKQTPDNEPAPDLAVGDEADAEVLLPKTEQTQITNLVIKEAKEVLADVKEGFNTFAVEPEQFDAITSAPAKLAQIQGALAVMNLDRAARLLGAANAFIREDVIAAQAHPDNAQLDTLADAITSIEYYLEAIEEGRGQPEGVLAVAEISVEQLGHPMDSVPDQILVADDAMPGEQQAADVADTHEAEVMEPQGGDDAAISELTLDTEIEVAASDSFDAEATQEMAASETLPEAAPEAMETPPAAAEPEEYLEEDIDEEILEIFVEEADEVLGTMTDCLHAWRANNEDAKSLETLRRSYHTIKGSGRLAGAMVMGEFAWAIESLLNRVLDNKIAPSPGMFALLEKAETVVRGLLAHLKKETDVRPPLKSLAAQANAMAEGTEFAVSDIASVDIISPSESTVEPVQVDSGDSESESSVGEAPSAVLIEEPSAVISVEPSAVISEEPSAVLSEEPSAVISEESPAESGEAPSLTLEETSPELSLDANEDGLSHEMVEEDEGLLLEESQVDELSLEQEDVGPEASSLQDSIDELRELAEDLTPDITLDESLNTEPVEETVEEVAEPVASEDSARAALIEVFRKETATHLAAIRAFLTDADGQDSVVVNDDLHRALHTLHGSARMADVVAISVLSEPMDRVVRDMHQRSLALDGNGQQLLRDVADRIESIADSFTQPGFEAPAEEEILARIAALHESVLSTPAPETMEQEDFTTVPAALGDEEDDELVSVFIEEADEILAGTDDMMQRWEAADEDDHSALIELQRALHTLKGGARLANIFAIGDLTHDLETILEGITEGNKPVAAQLPAMVQQGLDWLMNAIEQVRQGNFPDDASDLRAQIAALLNGSPEQENEDVAQEEAAQAPFLAGIEDEAQLPDEMSGEAPDDRSGEDSEDDGVLLVDEPLIDEPETTQATEELPAEEAFEELEEAAPTLETVGIEPEAVAAAEVDYDPDLLEVFLEEAEELQESTEDTLQKWAEEHEQLEHVAELQRLLHTLKGGARMANVLAVGDLAHAMESLLERITDGRIKPQPEHVAVIQACHDWLIGGLEAARKLQPIAASTELLMQLEAAISGKTYEASQAPAAVEETPHEPEPVSAVPEAAATTSTEELEELADAVALDQVGKVSTEKKVASSDEQVRVRADLLNNLVNFSGEINIYNSRIAQQLGASRFNLAELDQTVHRLREQLRKFEIETETQIMYRHETTGGDTEDFDPLELDRFSTMQQLSRSMVESLGDLTSIQALLDNLSSETDVLLLQQQRITSELQEGLMRTRMVAFSSVLPRLRRILRQTCKEVGKEAKLQVTGGEGEIDRTQLNRIVPALEHILRNAIGHGLEKPDVRTKAGKPASGNVHIVFTHEGSEVVLTISDDGAGINLEALRKKAIEKGRMQPDANLSDTEIMEFILESGFSTAEEVTQISGRGVGMDVVNTEVKQLGGTLHIDSEAGKGTTFTLRLPLTVLVNQALMVQAGEATYAIQLPNVEHVVRASLEELTPLVSGEQLFLEYAGNQYQYMNLGTVLQGTPPQLPAERQRVPLMLIRSADHRIALHVDNLLGRQEIVIKSVGPQLSTVGVLSGATILPDGEVALILDVANLVRSALAQQHGKAEPLMPGMEAVAEAEEKVPTVMIVDDSITVRKVTERLLKRYDYNIITAKDGVDALTVMLEQIPDIMLLDVEMPRMDGYELATTMRNDERLKEVPIIMITSRTGDKHRQRALDIGVNQYMGKPYQESELIDNIRSLTGVTLG